MLTFLGIIAGIFAIVAAFTYIRSVLTGETKPERGAYIIWAITSTIAFVAYWAEGASDSLWFVLGDFIVGLIMLVLAFTHGYGWNLKRHAAGFAAAAAGLALWVVTSEPFIALFASILVDAVGSVLVMVKSYEAPETEHFGSWAIYLVGAALALAAVGQWNFSLLFYPAYAILAAAGVCGAILAGRASAKRHKRPPRKPRITEKIP